MPPRKTFVFVNPTDNNIKITIEHYSFEQAMYKLIEYTTLFKLVE
jgi:hypothetical protein